MAEWYGASVSWAVDSGHTNDFNIGYSQLPCLTLSIEGTLIELSKPGRVTPGLHLNC